MASNNKDMYNELLKVVQNTFLVYPQETDVIKVVEDMYRAYPQKWEMIRSIEDIFTAFAHDPQMIINMVRSLITHKKTKNISRLEFVLTRSMPNMNQIIKKLVEEHPDVETEKIISMANKQLAKELVVAKKQIIQSINNTFDNNSECPHEIIKKKLLMYFEGLALPFDVSANTFQHIPKESDDWLQINPDQTMLISIIKETFKSNPNQMKLIQMAIMEHVGALKLPEIDSMVEDCFKSKGYYSTKGAIVWKLTCKLANSSA